VRLAVWILPCLLSAAAVAADDAADGHAWLADRVVELGELRARMPVEQVAGHLLDTAVDLERLADHVLDDYIEEALEDFDDHLEDDELLYFAAVSRQRLEAALAERVVADLTAALTRAPVGWRLTDASFEDGRGQVDLRPETAETPRLRLLLHRRDDGSWRIEDLQTGERRWSWRIREEYRETFSEKLSPGVLEAQLLHRDYVVIEDFRAAGDGELPLGWRWRDRDEDRRKPYRVQSEAGRTWLAAHDSGGSVMIGRFAHWNPRQYPVMTWCWRADAIPPGGDERFGHTNDSAAGIYVFFSQTWIGMPRHIKYVWSTTLDTGFVGRRDRIARPWFVVVESGDEHLGQWRLARVNLEADYERTWGGRPKSRTSGLGLLTDANSTDSRAEAYYADLRVWSREAVDQGRVRDHCDTYRDLDMPQQAAAPPVSGDAARTNMTPSGATP
jgi:hypothetical protein